MRKTIAVIGIAAAFFVAGNIGAAEDTVGVVAYNGDVQIILSGEMEAVLPKTDMRLKEGARIITAQASSVEIAYDRHKQNTVRIKENSEVVIKLDGDEKIELVDGEILALMKGLKKGETFRVRTPCATCGARGTVWSTKTDGKTANVAVISDRVFVRGINEDGSDMEKQVWVEKGFERRIEKFEKPGKMEKIEAVRFSKMEKEAKEPVQPKEEPRKEDASIDPSAVLPMPPADTHKTMGEDNMGPDNPLDRTGSMDRQIDLTRGRDRMDTMAEKRDAMMGRQELMEKREMMMEKSSTLREGGKEGVRDFRDDKRLEQIIEDHNKPPYGDNQPPGGST